MAPAWLLAVLVVASFAGPEDEAKLAKAVQLLQLAPREVEEDSLTGVVCQSVEFGISWLRVRSHFWRHISRTHLADLPHAAAQVRIALREDAHLPTEALTRMELGQLNAKCREGKAAMQLVFCLGEGADLPVCSVAELDSTARYALGLASDVQSFEGILRSGWPLHALLAAILSRLPEAAQRGSRAAELRHGLERAAGKVDAQDSASLIAALSASCPHRAPFDRLLCGHSANETGSVEEVSLATASASLALAGARLWQRPWWQLQQSDQLSDRPTDASAAMRCAEPELSILCPAAIVDADTEEDLQRATASFQDALLPDSPYTMHRLAASPWPVVELAAEVASAMRGRREELSEGPLRGTCGCEMDGWTSREASAVAAGLRVLRRLRDAEGDLDRVHADATSEDSELACPRLPPRETGMPHKGDGRILKPGQWEKEKDVPKTFHTAKKSLETVWGVVPLYYSEVNSRPDLQERVLATAEFLRHAGPEDFDAGLCVPGALVLSMVCALVGLARNVYDAALENTVAMEVFIMGSLPCIMTLSEELRRDDPEALRMYSETWSPLVPWLLEPRSFMEKIWGPYLRSNRWWLGAGSKNGWHDDPREHLPSEEQRTGPANACAGVWKSEKNPDHQCHAAVRGDVAISGAPSLEEGRRTPSTRVLGVGPMKAGSTAVWQALGAATQWTMGFDCHHLAKTPVVSRVKWRKDSLSKVVDACMDEVFSWELVKDPMLTPLALRLATMWPAVSSHGEQLRMYFLVRNPFDCTRSLIDHLVLKLRVDPSDTDGQTFSLGNMPQAARFTRGKQLFLDVTREGLNFTGYIDAAVQRWALTVDEYLRCPSRFVLARYEDFKDRPVETTEALMRGLGLGHLWDAEAAARVRDAASVQYQSQGKTRSHGFEQVFGRPLLARLAEAVESRAALLGYGELLQDVMLGTAEDRAELRRGPAIDMPALPTAEDCG